MSLRYQLVGMKPVMPALTIFVLCGVMVACDSTPEPMTIVSPDVLSDLSDDFADAGTVSEWTVRSQFEGGSSDGQVTIENGTLKLFPNQDRFFLDGDRGLSLFKAIDTNEFPNLVVEAQVGAHTPGTDDPPTENFQSAGLVIYPDLTDMRSWVVVNIGRQSQTLAFEDKTTVNNQSTLTLYDTNGQHVGFVRLCLVGQNVTAYTRLPNETSWTQRNSFTHDVGMQVGVGSMINDFTSGSASVEGRFDYIRFTEIANQSGCTAPVN